MYYEELEIGQKFQGISVTVTEAHVVLFGSLTGDKHPVHTNEEWAKTTRYGRRIAQGMLTASFMVPGMNHTIVGEQMVLNLGEAFTFREPVFFGDTITTDIEIIEKEPKKNWGLVRVKNIAKKQTGEVVAEGIATLGMPYKSSNT